MHTLLGSDSDDPSFCPEQPSASRSGLLTATIDDEIEAIFLELPDDTTTSSRSAAAARRCASGCAC